MNQEVIKLLTVLCQNVSLDVKITPKIEKTPNAQTEQNITQNTETEHNENTAERQNKDVLLEYITTCEKYLNIFKSVIENS